ncbi:DUF4234 domain-containing protein [Paenibacillus endoradicis]|uniref:DUF4234 domain-containing protein n=1 Tax=Paenibacillus endoradicis TaxID=2972487 RepID=UPI0021592715|nr:DUF4234 domain-containing protein [Paenibacillus endoradicis]MCR8658829.1 DUF4234 domain-containing protein [Paenibacillus endoradicis]
MIQERNIALCIILSLITCGLYGIYWFIVLTNDLGKLSGDSSFTGGKHFLLTIVTCGIWSIVWGYQAGKHIYEAQRQRGFHGSDNSILYLVLFIFGFGIVSYALVQNDVNKLL